MSVLLITCCEEIQASVTHKMADFDPQYRFPRSHITQCTEFLTVREKVSGDFEKVVEERWQSYAAVY